MYGFKSKEQVEKEAARWESLSTEQKGDLNRVKEKDIDVLINKYGLEETIGGVVTALRKHCNNDSPVLNFLSNSLSNVLVQILFFKKFHFKSIDGEKIHKKPVAAPEGVTRAVGPDTPKGED